MQIMSPIRLRIAELRAVKGWTQAELAKAAGVSRATVNRIESGAVEGVTLTTVEALADALGIEAGYLIEHTPKGKRR